jgi:hypothetical protein
MAAKKGYELIVERLCKEGAKTDIRIKDYGETPLWIGCKEGHAGVVSTLLTYNADPNIADSKAITPLLAAIYRDHATIALTLLQRGANPNQARDNGITPLIMASYKGHEPLVKALLVSGAQANYRAPLALGGGRALHYALQENHSPLVPLLEDASFKERDAEQARFNLQEKQKLEALESQIQQLASLFQYFAHHHTQTNSLKEETILSLKASQETLWHQEERKRQALESHIKALEDQLKRLSINQSTADILRAKELTELKNQHTLLWQEHQAFQMQEEEKTYLKQHPLLNTFYSTLERKLTQLFLAYKVLDTGLVAHAKTTSNKMADGINLLGEFIPLPGLKAATTILSLTINAVSDKREEKKVSLVARLTQNVTIMEQEIESAARMLSYRYEEQIKALTQKGATTLAECGVRRLIEYMRAGQLNDQDRLAHQLVQSVSTFQSHQGKFPFSNKTIETHTPRPSKWTDKGIFQSTGLKTKEGRFFIKAESKHAKYGYRLGTEQEVHINGYTVQQTF